MVEVSGTSLATEKQCDHQLTFSLANDKKKPSRQTVLFIHKGTYPSHLSIGIADVCGEKLDELFRRALIGCEQSRQFQRARLGLY